MDTIARALEARPSLNVEISGEFDLIADEAGLKAKILDQQLRGVIGLDAAGEEPWTDQTRTDALVKRYLQVFGEPPVDTGRMASMPSSDSVIESAQVEPLASPENGDGLLGMIRRLFGKPPSEASSSDGRGADTSTPSETGVTPVAQLELPIFRSEVIAAKLIEAIQVTAEDFTALAKARALGVRAHLESKGIALSRLKLSEPKAGAPRVKLELR
jgi:hypothetical protein